MQAYNIFDSLKTFAKLHQSDLNAYVFYSLAAPIGDVFLPHYYGKVIDNLANFPPTKTFSCNKTSICIIMVLWAVKQYLSRSLDKLDAVFIPKLTAYFRNEIVEKILFYYEHRPEDPKVGELLSKIIRLPSIIRDLFNQVRTMILPNFLIMLFASGYAFYVNAMLGLLMLGGIGTFVLISSHFIKEVMDTVRKAHNEYDELHEELIDLLSNTTNVYSSGMIKDELIRITDRQKSYGKVLQKGIEGTAKFKTLFSTSYFAMFTVVSYYTMKLYSEKKINVASATSMLIILLFCIMDLNDVSNSMRDFIFNIGGLVGLQDYLNEIFVDENTGTLDVDTSNANTSNANTSNANTSNADTPYSSNSHSPGANASNSHSSNADTSNANASNANASNADTSNADTSNAGTSNAGTSNAGTSNADTRYPSNSHYPDVDTPYSPNITPASYAPKAMITTSFDTQITNNVNPFFSDIVLDQVSIKIGKKVIIRDYTSIFHRGKLNVISGSVGKGKSTLLKAILKIQPISSGRILIGDKDVSSIPTKLVRKSIMYVPQNINLFNRSVYDNIVYGVQKIRTQPVSPDEIFQLMERYNIDEITPSELDRSAGKGGCNLSGGQKQIVLLLRAMLRNSPIILLDEPTSALSLTSKDKVLKILRNMCDGTRTIITTTHDPDLMKISDHHVSL